MSSENPANPQSVHDFTVKDTHGNDVSLNKYKGNVLLIVNIASKCGLTSSNYKELTELHEKYSDKRESNKNRVDFPLSQPKINSNFLFACDCSFQNTVFPM